MRWTVLSGGAAWLAAAGLLAACADGTGPQNEKRAAMAPISFNEIAGWADDKHSESLASFRRSCPKLTAGPDTKIATDGGFKTITQAEWDELGEHGTSQMSASQLPLLFGMGLEDATPEEREAMIAILPAPVRLLMRTYGAWRYRRYVSSVRGEA